jgi:hypothetical protein
MTYKTTSQSHNRLTRTGSQSLRPLATGRVLHLPPQAEEEALYEGLKSQYFTLLKQHERLAETIQHYDRRLANPKHPDYADLLIQRDALGKQYHQMAVQLGHLKKTARDAGEKSFATIFMQIAGLMLSPTQYHKISEETRDIMGRSAHEIKQGYRPDWYNDPAPKALPPSKGTLSLKLTKPKAEPRIDWWNCPNASDYK